MEDSSARRVEREEGEERRCVIVDVRAVAVVSEPGRGILSVLIAFGASLKV